MLLALSFPCVSLPTSLWIKSRKNANAYKYILCVFYCVRSMFYLPPSPTCCKVGYQLQIWQHFKVMLSASLTSLCVYITGDFFALIRSLMWFPFFKKNEDIDLAYASHWMLVFLVFVRFDDIMLFV